MKERTITTTYTIDEVQYLVENYLALREKAKLPDKRRPEDCLHACLVDLQRAMHTLPIKLRQIIFLVGVAAQTTRQAGEVLYLDCSNVFRGYHRGLGRLVALMNGE